jgi:hypothetical protein
MPVSRRTKRLSNSPIAGRIDSGLVNAVGKKIQEISLALGEGQVGKQIAQTRMKEQIEV